MVNLVTLEVKEPFGLMATQRILGESVGWARWDMKFGEIM